MTHGNPLCNGLLIRKSTMGTGPVLSNKRVIFIWPPSRYDPRSNNQTSAYMWHYMENCLLWTLAVSLGENMIDLFFLYQRVVTVLSLASLSGSKNLWFGRWGSWALSTSCLHYQLCYTDRSLPQSRKKPVLLCTTNWLKHCAQFCLKMFARSFYFV